MFYSRLQQVSKCAEESASTTLNVADAADDTSEDESTDQHIAHDLELQSYAGEPVDLVTADQQSPTATQSDGTSAPSKGSKAQRSRELLYIQMEFCPRTLKVRTDLPWLRSG